MAEPLLSLRAVKATFPVPGYGVVRAVDGVSLEMGAGEIVGLVGESGCGKTTIGRCITGQVIPDSGEIRLDGRPLGRRRSSDDRRAVQMVFQDPSTSLNPRLSVRSVLAELVRVHKLAPKDKVEQRCRELMALVGMPPEALDGHPHQFSGGQRQRIAIARALAVEPRLLIADEPVSALDVSVQATILQLFDDLRHRLGLAVLLISHNLAVVRYLSDRVSVMYLGAIAETATRDVLYEDPRAPYTQVLLEAAPRLSEIGKTPEPGLKGDPPSAVNIPSGCRFHTRCPRAEAVCAIDEPALLPVDEDGPGRDASGAGLVQAGRVDEVGGTNDPAAHLAACHFRRERAAVSQTVKG